MNLLGEEVDKKYDIRKRTLELSVDTIKHFQANPKASYIDQIIIKQLIRAITSIGANIQEAKGAQSQKDYINFFSIALKSANESKYWFEIILSILKSEDCELAKLYSETDEIAKIIASCIIKMRKNNIK